MIVQCNLTARFFFYITDFFLDCFFSSAFEHSLPRFEAATLWNTFWSGLYLQTSLAWIFLTGTQLYKSLRHANFPTTVSMHTRNTMTHSQNSNKSTLEYDKVKFCLQHYSIFTPLTFHSHQKMYKSQHMLMT